MKVLKWLGIILLAGVVGWAAGMAIHKAQAAVHPDGGMTIIPRGPGGPPVVILDDEPGPRWKIVVTMEGPPGKEQLTYGNRQDGIYWFKTKGECEKALKGGDAKLAASLKLLKAQVKQMKMPVEVTAECKPDNSV